MRTFPRATVGYVSRLVAFDYPTFAVEAGPEVITGQPHDIASTMGVGELGRKNCSATTSRIQPPCFDSIAAADANGDGQITLEELGKIQLSELRGLGPYGTYADAGDAGGIGLDGATPDSEGPDAEAADAGDSD